MSINFSVGFQQNSGVRRLEEQNSASQSMSEMGRRATQHNKGFALLRLTKPRRKCARKQDGCEPWDRVEGAAQGLKSGAQMPNVMQFSGEELQYSFRICRCCANRYLPEQSGV
jgi:hypothetical protein